MNFSVIQPLQSITNQLAWPFTWSSESSSFGMAFSPCRRLWTYNSYIWTLTSQLQLIEMCQLLSPRVLGCNCSFETNPEGQSFRWDIGKQEERWKSEKIGNQRKISHIGAQKTRERTKIAMENKKWKRKEGKRNAETIKKGIHSWNYAIYFPTELQMRSYFCSHFLGIILIFFHFLLLPKLQSKPHKYIIKHLNHRYHWVFHHLNE